MTIQQILKTKGTEVLNIPDTTTIAAAAARLAANNIGALVVTYQAGQPLGLFTESDLARSVAEFGISAGVLRDHYIVHQGPAHLSHAGN